MGCCDRPDVDDAHGPATGKCRLPGMNAKKDYICHSRWEPNDKHVMPFTWFTCMYSQFFPIHYHSSRHTGQICSYSVKAQTKPTYQCNNI